MKTDKSAGGSAEELRQRVAELEALLDLERSTVKGMAEAEDRHNQVFELMSDAVLIHREGRIIFANSTAVGLYGAETTAQLVGRTNLDLVHPDDREKVLARRRELLAGNRIDLFIRRGLRFDGSEFMVESRGSLITWEGKPAVLIVLRDVTARVRSAEALRESEARYRELFEGSDLGIQIGIKETGQIYANRACANLFGYDSPDELFEAPRWAIVAEYDRDRVIKYRDDMLSGQAHVPSYEFDGLRKDGSMVPVQAFMRRITWDGQEAIYRTFIDLTDRKLAENESRKSEEQLRAITDNSPSIIYLRDMDLNLLKINKTYEEFYGVTQEEAAGRQGHEWLSDGIAEELINGDRKVLTTGVPTELEFEAVDAAGKSHFMRSIKFPVLNEEGVVVAVGGTTTDITERNLVRNELKQQKAFFETLVENLPAKVTMKDTDGKYVFVNRVICEASNKTPEEIIGKTPKEAFGVDSPIADFSRTAMATGQPITGIERKSTFSEERLISSSFVPIKGADGEVDRLLTISFDITESQQREEQLRQAQKMEAVGQLTGGVAHDFNNLLTVVLGNLQLLQGRVSTDTVARSYVDSALSGARRGAELTHRLLAFSRKQALVPVTIDPRELVDGLLNLMRRTLGETIEIEVFSGSEFCYCDADPAQLESAILNLAINARDAMAGGGKLAIKTENVILNDDYSAAHVEVTPGQYVMISVADNGTGIPADAIGHVFEPFFTTKEVGKGSGLGLSMVYGFAKQSGGHVTIDSEDGVGTTVKIYLPRSVERPADALFDERESEPQARGETILVVEDDPDVRSLAVALLSDLGYEILEAEDAQSALAVLDNNPRVTMLFTDVILPGGMNGPTLAEEVKRRYPEIFVLFTSGYTDDVTIPLGEVDAGIELLNKPFGKSDLALKVRSVLDRAVS